MHGLAVFNPYRFSLTLRRSRPPTAAAELSRYVSVIYSDKLQNGSLQ